MIMEFVFLLRPRQRWRSIVMSTSVCVCVSVCLRRYLRNHTRDRCQFFCACYIIVASATFAAKGIIQSPITSSYSCYSRRGHSVCQSSADAVYRSIGRKGECTARVKSDVYDCLAVIYVLNLSTYLDAIHVIRNKPHEKYSLWPPTCGHYTFVLWFLWSPYVFLPCGFYLSFFFLLVLFFLA